MEPEPEAPAVLASVEGRVNNVVDLDQPHFMTASMKPMASLVQQVSSTLPPPPVAPAPAGWTSPTCET